MSETLESVAELLHELGPETDASFKRLGVIAQDVQRVGQALGHARRLLGIVQTLEMREAQAQEDLKRLDEQYGNTNVELTHIRSQLEDATRVTDEVRASAQEAIAAELAVWAAEQRQHLINEMEAEIVLHRGERDTVIIALKQAHADVDLAKAVHARIIGQVAVLQETRQQLVGEIAEVTR